MEYQNRFKSPVFWGGVSVLIINFLITIGAINLEQSEALKTVVTTILNAIAAFAVANNPTNKTGY
jgi:uncharacterized membrane protein